jgi:hypothetical protein
MTIVPGGYDPADDPYREWDAAYVLGALAPAERREYERHLAACEPCLAAVGEIAGIPGVLGTVAPRERAALLAPETGPAGHDDGAGTAVVPLAGVAAAARRSRARRRSLLAAAAAALVAGGVTGGVALAGGFAPGGTDGGVPVAASAAGARTLVLQPVGGTDVHAELTATSTAWGTRLDWRCRYPTPPVPSSGRADGPGAADRTTYELVIVDSSGARTVVATWTAEGLEAEGLGASSAVPLDDVQRVEIAVGGREEPLAVATL